MIVIGFFALIYEFAILLKTQKCQRSERLPEFWSSVAR